MSSASDEPRSLHVQALRGRAPETRFVEVTTQTRDACTWTEDGNAEQEIQLTAASSIDNFWSHVESPDGTYLDITGLEHHVWAAFIASAIRSQVALKVVYVEPLKYRRITITDGGGDLFDLSSGFAGIAPLPGFARLAEPEDDEFFFLPLLGFEGRRFSYLLSEVAPAGGNVFPVIGVPGFQPEFVGFAYDGNMNPLLESEAWQRAFYATANCPFSLFYALQDFRANYPSGYFKVATIGTKPHSLGAVLFAIAYPRQVELIYDHPRRKDKRTEGAARLLVYDVGALASAGHL